MNETRSSRLLFPLLISSALTALTFLLSISLLGMRYFSNDDSMMAAIAAGAFGDSSKLIFCNVLFGYLLKPFYWLAFANWYVILQLLACAIALCSVFTVLMKKHSVLVGSIWFLVLLFCYGYYIYYYFQFTISAFVIISCGLILIAESFEHITLVTVIGLALTVFGSWVRFDCFLAAGALSACLFLLRFGELEKKHRKTAALVMALLFGLVFGSEAIDRTIYTNDPAWAAYTEYNAARSTFSDCASYSLASPEDLYSFGISEVDYVMLQKWDFYDPKRFTPELLNEMSQSLLEQDASSISAVSNLFSFLKENPLQALPLLTLTALCLLRTKVNLRSLALLGTLLTFLALLFYLQVKYNNRLTQWVAIGLLFSLCIYLIYICIYMDKKHARSWQIPFVLLCTCVALGWQTYTEFYLYTDSYLAVRAENHTYIARLSEEPENIYFLSTVSTSFSASEDIWNPSAAGSFDNVVLLGGWMCYHPNRTAVLEKYGITRPIVDSVDNPNAYFDHHNIEDIVAYASQELGCEVIAVATGQNAYCPYQLVRAEKTVTE